MTTKLDRLFDRLQTSAFRRKFHLRGKERAYLQDKGMETVLSHAQDFVRNRLADANPKNDGRQTPWGNHPVFVAQHATATCCRGCLEKWHGIPKGKTLSDAEQAYIVAVIELSIRQK